MAPADELVFLRAGIGRDQRKHRGAIGRRNGYPALSGLKPSIKGQIEPKLIQVESEASLLIANKDIDRVNAEIWRGRAAHGRDS